MSRLRDACWLVAVGLLLGCAAEIAARPPAIDPTSPQSEESPIQKPSPLNVPDPLLSIAAEPPPDASAPDKAPPMPEHQRHAPGHHHPGMGHQAAPPAPKEKTAASHVCPMHPEVRSDKAGRCPKCGMKLMPAKPESEHP